METPIIDLLELWDEARDRIEEKLYIDGELPVKEEDVD